MIKQKVLRTIYQRAAKPIFFTQDPEAVHDFISDTAKILGNHQFTKLLTSAFLNYQNDKLNQNILGINFANPVGLSAGFDYNGHMAEILPEVGFGFNTIGTVTAKYYEGNVKPRLARLVKSKALLVNKGFKSDGADTVYKSLAHKNLTNGNIGISIGSTNIPEIDTVEKAIEDYLYTFEKFKTENYVKYFELNISCPNTTLTEGFGNKKNLESLLKELDKQKIKKPIFIKMANEIGLNKTDQLIHIALQHKIDGFIFSNLVKDRKNKYLDKNEIKKIKSLKGNFSGPPTAENSLKLISHAYKEYGRETVIIGCGGVFSAQGAYEKIKHGASLVQLITGLIYEGPQLIGEINEGLVQLLEKDDYSNISEAIGAYHR